MKQPTKRIDVNRYRDFEKISKDFSEGSKTTYTFDYYNTAGVLIIHTAIELADAVTIKFCLVETFGSKLLPILIIDS